jgi:DNA-binding NtrC family response regulator
MRGNILIVDDNKSIRTALEMMLQTEYSNVFCLKNPTSLLSTIQEYYIDVILLDMNFAAGINTGNEGLFWLNEINKLDSSISVIMITAYGDVELAVKAVKNGAFDFILKPWDNNKLLSTVNAALKLRKSSLENSQLRSKTKRLEDEIMSREKTFIGQSKQILDVLKMVNKVAKTDVNVLITGENGTGKELIARELHQLSKRNKKILLNVDMGSISETLFESELFGHKKGAFTDAKEDRMGRFEMANGGTLFLDEIGNLPMSLQAKILAALQNRTITPLGSNKVINFDVRLIAATNKDLKKMIESGSFREDLFFRINTITIELPPLREREYDIILLAEFYLRKYAKKYEKENLKLSQAAVNKLMKYNWPGNVRELQHSIEKAVILATNNILGPDNFSLQSNIKKNMNIKTIEEMEKDMIIACIDKEKGNMSKVAKKLGITRQTLYNKLKKYEL